MRLYLDCPILCLKHRRSSRNGSCYYYSVPHLKADLATKVEKMRQSILEGVNMNYPPPSALLPSPTFVPPMVPSLYPVSLYPRAMGPMPPPPQGRSRGFAGQYLRMRCLSNSVYFIVTHPVIIASYRISSFTYIFTFCAMVWFEEELTEMEGCSLWRRAHCLPRPLSIEVIDP